MSSVERLAFPGNKKDHPFLVLCLSMLAVGIAAELSNAVNGRFSATGNRILELVPLGILLYGLLEHFFPGLCRALRKAPLILLAVGSVAMLVSQELPTQLPLSLNYGVVIGPGYITGERGHAVCRRTQREIEL